MANSDRVIEIGEVGISHRPFPMGIQGSAVCVNVIDNRVMVGGYLFTQQQAMELQGLIGQAVVRAIYRAPAPAASDQEPPSVVAERRPIEPGAIRGPFQYPVSISAADDRPVPRRPEIERVERNRPLMERLSSAIFHRIHEDIGTASMCWDNPGGAGVFRASDASALAFNLCHFIADELEKARETAVPDSELILSTTLQAHPFLSGPADFCDGSITVGPHATLPAAAPPGFSGSAAEPDPPGSTWRTRGALL